MPPKKTISSSKNPKVNGDGEENRSLFSLYLKDDEKAVLQRAASRIGLPVAVFVRVAALEKARKDLGE